MQHPALISSLTDLHDFALSLHNDGYQNFLLEGELGVGKTQFVKEFVASLGGDKDKVQSPSYTYMNTYHTPLGEVLHIDMYRFEAEQNAFAKGVFDAIDRHDYVLIERPQREEQYVDDTRTRLSFEFGDKEQRIITIQQ